MRRILLAVALCAALIPSSTLRAGVLRTVALTGTPAPGTPEGVVFKSLGHPEIDRDGNTAFNSYLEGDGIGSTNDLAIWAERGENLVLIARDGDPAPGFPDGTTLNSARRPEINRGGDVAFYAVAGGSQGVFIERQGTLSLVARGQRASVTEPTAPTIAAFFPSFALNDSGQIAFAANHHPIRQTPPTPDRYDAGVWLVDTGSPTLVARIEDSAPGQPLDARFRSFAYPAYNNNGFLAFHARHSRSDEGLWVNRTGALESVAFTGMPAPGTLDGATFQTLLQARYPVPVANTEPAMNEAGRTAFGASLESGTVIDENDSGVWSEGRGSLALVAREGQQAPGLSAGIVFDDMRTVRAVLDEAGNTAFSTRLAGTGVNLQNRESLWSNRGGALRLLARQGDQPPGAEPGTQFQWIGDPVVNSSGRIAFHAGLQDEDTEAARSGFGVWAEDELGVIRSIAQTGDVFEVAPGDFRIIESVWAGPNTWFNEDLIYRQRSSYFNDKGQVAFLTLFTDGSYGVFVSNLVAVPEPRSWALIVVAAIAACRRRRN